MSKLWTIATDNLIAQCLSVMYQRYLHVTHRQTDRKRKKKSKQDLDLFSHLSRAQWSCLDLGPESEYCADSLNFVG